MPEVQRRYRSYSEPPPRREREKRAQRRRGVWRRQRRSDQKRRHASARDRYAPRVAARAGARPPSSATTLISNVMRATGGMRVRYAATRYAVRGVLYIRRSRQNRQEVPRTPGENAKKETSARCRQVYGTRTKTQKSAFATPAVCHARRSGKGGGRRCARTLKAQNPCARHGALRARAQRNLSAEAYARRIRNAMPARTPRKAKRDGGAKKAAGERYGVSGSVQRITRMVCGGLFSLRWFTGQ